MMESSLNVSVLCVYKHKHDTKTWLDWVSDMPWLVIKQMFQCHLIILRCKQQYFPLFQIHCHTYSYKKTNENDNLNKVLNLLSSFSCAKLNLFYLFCVGCIGIVDYDTVEISNLHRQVLHTESRVNTSKAESIKIQIQQ